MLRKYSLETYTNFLSFEGAPPSYIEASLSLIGFSLTIRALLQPKCHIPIKQIYIVAISK